MCVQGKLSHCIGYPPELMQNDELYSYTFGEQEHQTHRKRNSKERSHSNQMDKVVSEEITSFERQMKAPLVNKTVSRLLSSTSRSVKALPVSLEELHSILERLELNRELKQNSSDHISNAYEEGTRGESIEDFFQPDEEGDNVLMSALIHNRFDVAFELLKSIPSYEYLDFQNNLGQSVLHLAVILNAASLVRKFVAWGAGVVSYDVNGNTPLHIACRDGNLDCVMALTTPLSANEIAERTYYVPYQRLPQDMEIRNYAGQTCLHLAALNGHTHIMDYLLRKLYADLNSPNRTSGETLLHFAVSTQNMTLMAYLLQYRKLNVNAERYDKLTPLDIAKLMKNKTMFDLLIRAGATSSPSYELCDDRLFNEYDDISINGVQMMDI